jgi:hypothetical protein
MRSDPDHDSKLRIRGSRSEKELLTDLQYWRDHLKDDGGRNFFGPDHFVAKTFSSWDILTSSALSDAFSDEMFATGSETF